MKSPGRKPNILLPSQKQNAPTSSNSPEFSARKLFRGLSGSAKKGNPPKTGSGATSVALSLHLNNIENIKNTIRESMNQDTYRNKLDKEIIEERI